MNTVLEGKKFTEKTLIVQVVAVYLLFFLVSYMIFLSIFLNFSFFLICDSQRLFLVFIMPTYIFLLYLSYFIAVLVVFYQLRKVVFWLLTSRDLSDFPLFGWSSRIARRFPVSAVFTTHENLTGLVFHFISFNR